MEESHYSSGSIFIKRLNFNLRIDDCYKTKLNNPNKLLYLCWLENFVYVFLIVFSINLMSYRKMFLISKKLSFNPTLVLNLII